MKFRFSLFLVALILAAQVVGIFLVSFARERERANNPTFLLECASYDPRDFLRGHYLPLNFKILRDVPAAKFDAFARERLRAEHGDDLLALLKESYVYVWSSHTDALWLVLAPNAGTGFWEVERVTFDEPKIDFNANPEAKRVALRFSGLSLRFERDLNVPAPKNLDEIFDPASAVRVSSLDFSLPNSRFYLSEEKAKRFDSEIRGNAERVVSAELFLRADGTPALKRILVDGKEF